jgi:hypothetical protein
MPQPFVGETPTKATGTVALPRPISNGYSVI